MTRSRSLAAILRRAAVIQAITAVCVGLVTIVAFLFYRDAARDSADARSDLALTSQLEAEVFSAETGLRGYILVGREDFLDPYERAFPVIDRTLEQLARTVEPADVQSVRELDAVIDEWRGVFAEPVLEHLLRGQRAAAFRIIRSGRGKQRIDRFRRTVAALEQREQQRIERGDERVELAALVAILALVGGAGVYAVSSLLLRVRLQRSVLEPLEGLTDSARRFGAGDFESRAAVGGVHEVNVLASNFNDMAARVSGVVGELRAIDEMKTRFVSSVSHELRTPLTAIKGYLELLLFGVAGELNDEQRDYADVAVRNAERLEALINDLLLLSRLQSGRLKLAIDELDVVALIRDLVRGLEPVAAEKHLGLVVRAPTGPVHIEGDELRLQQTFSNLLSNAIKFSPPQAEVLVEVVPDGQVVVVEVSDSGVGIPPEELPRLTERFFRASTAGHVEGTGLGLAITREIVERHGGRLEIESVVGAGSTFRVRLPVRIASPDRDDERALADSSAKPDDASGGS